MVQEQLKYLLFNYTKTMGKYNRIKYPKQIEKEIRGNALIPVPESYIKEFNIKWYKDLWIVESVNKSCKRKIINEDGSQRLITVREFKKKTREGRGQTVTLKKIKASS
jgi:hypothetical protein